MRILAIDYGERRLGVAISDPLGMFAFPLTVIDIKKEEKWQNKLKKIVKEKDVKKIVLGLPLTLGGKECEMSKKVREFGEWLSSELGLQVELIDERFSSEVARRTLRSDGKTEKQMRGKLDMYSSAQLLQTYLDMINREKGTDTK
ncbi:MAG: Holliday junction resolvase RuvX [Candidatus Hydrogenedentes bacterium]|nr:Holliday junction resolvase RuvX [Candidatus Hydrogenedentota bacterium]